MRDASFGLECGDEVGASVLLGLIFGFSGVDARSAFCTFTPVYDGTPLLASRFRTYLGFTHTSAPGP